MMDQLCIILYIKSQNYGKVNYVMLTSNGVRFQVAHFELMKWNCMCTFSNIGVKSTVGVGILSLYHVSFFLLVECFGCFFQVVICQMKKYSLRNFDDNKGISWLIPCITTKLYHLIITVSIINYSLYININDRKIVKIVINS